MVLETQEKPQSQDTPLVEPGQSSGEKQVTPKKEKTYSETEYLKAVSDERTISGRLKTQLEAATKERDTFKSQAEEATAATEETKATIAELEADLETLGEDNLDAAEVLKIKKEIRAEKVKLAQEAKAEKEAIAELKKTLEKEREEWAGTVAEAQAAKFEVDVFELAEEYEGNKVYDQLKNICETIVEATGKTMTKEAIQKVADRNWSKKAPPDEEPAIIEDSGATSGGGGWNPDEHTPSENIQHGLDKLKKK